VRVPNETLDRFLSTVGEVILTTSQLRTAAETNGIGQDARLSGGFDQMDRVVGELKRRALALRTTPLLGLVIGDGTHWLVMKIFLLLCVFLWLRATFPRYRYDQIMRLGWKIFIPVTLVWLVVVGLWMQSPWSLWK